MGFFERFFGNSHQSPQADLASTALRFINADLAAGDPLGRTPRQSRTAERAGSALVGKFATQYPDHPTSTRYLVDGVFYLGDLREVATNVVMRHVLTNSVVLETTQHPPLEGAPLQTSHE